jgi:integrase
MSKVLTDPAVKGAKPRRDKKTGKLIRTEVPDRGLPGLYLIVQPSGKKSWAVRYRHRRKPIKFTIGPYPLIGLAKAREKAREVLVEASEGRDPQADKRRRLAATPEGDTFAAIVPRYLADHARNPKSQRSTKQVGRHLAKEILPRWGTKKLDEVHKRDVRELVDMIVNRGSPFSANNVFKVGQAFYRWAIKKDLVTESPFRGLEPPTTNVSRERVLTDNELRWLWRACTDIGVTGSFVRMLLLTGQRRTEVAELTESELAGRTWTIPSSRTKNKHEHMLQLPDAALQVLAETPRIGTSGFYFTNDGVKPISGFSAAKQRVDAAVLEQAKADGVTEIPEWTFHDLRRTVVSNMARLGVAIHVAEAVVNHKSGTIKGVAAIYNKYDYDAEKTQALAAWARELDVIVTGDPRGKVVALRG